MTIQTPRILIIGEPKTGTSALFYKIKPCMPSGTLFLFEPKDPLEALEMVPPDQAVLTKIHINHFTDSVLQEIFKRYNKLVCIVRDSRDTIIFQALWRSQVFYQDVSRIYTLYRLLKMLESGSQDVGIAALYREIFSEKHDVKNAKEKIISVVKANNPFLYKYEDMICGNDATLKQYLGMDVPAEPEDHVTIRSVVRTKTSGNWRHWFRPCDAVYFKEGMQDFLRFFGYDADDWEISQAQHINPEHCSGYFLKLIDQNRQDKGLSRISREELEQESKGLSGPKAIICGYEHGGTTLLSEILRRHPSVGSGFEGGFLLANRPADFPGINPYAGMMMCSWKLNREELVKICATDSWYDVYPRLAAVSSLIHEGHAWVIDKTPQYLRSLAEVMRKVPNVPVLLIVRDPRAVIWSYLKRSTVPEGGAQKMIEGFCDRYHSYWQGYQRAVAQGFSSRILVIQYEDLCLRPQEYVQKVCDFLGIDFEERFLNFESTFPNVYGKQVSSDYMFEYREHLSKEHQEMILARLQCSEAWFWEGGSCQSSEHAGSKSIIRRKKNNALNLKEYVQSIKQGAPGLEKLNDQLAVLLLREVFKRIASEIEAAPEGVVKVQGLGRFITKPVVPEKEGKKVVPKQVIFRDLQKTLNREDSYAKWIEQNEPKDDELNRQRLVKFNEMPKISIITPVFKTPEKMLIEMIESVIAQTYSCWELCIVDGGSGSTRIQEILCEYAGKDKRIAVKFFEKNEGMAGNTNTAISLATGDFIAFLDHDDILAPDALFEVVKAINHHPQAELLYSDEDHISEDGEIRCKPFFKPDFAPDTLRSYNYICHLVVLKTELGRSLGWIRSGLEGAQDHDLILRVTEKAREIIHIPKILYHWRNHSASMSRSTDTKTCARASGEKCLSDHLERIGLSGKVQVDESLFLYRIHYVLRVAPLVSIIIPNKDQVELLDRCVRSILQKSTYKNIEILIIENRSEDGNTFLLYDKLKERKNIRIIPWDHAFNFSALNNFAVKEARGDVVLFLNNDTEVITPDWIESMLSYALRKDVGAVGAKLYYPDLTIQHAGVIIGLGGMAGHSHKNFPKDHGGNARRLSIVQNLSAVTGACLMMRKSVFEEVHGFEEELTVAYNDVDLCLKIREKGYLIVWTPYAELYHDESKTRGYENTPAKVLRVKGEMEFIRRRWPSIFQEGDPYYNCNLTLARQDFSIRIR